MQDHQSELGFTTSDDWTVQDFHTFFHQLNILYNRIYVLDELVESEKVRKISNVLYGSLSRMDSTNQLLLQSIEIHSPGEFSLIGVGSILREFRELWKDVSYRNKIEKQDLEEDLRHKRSINRLTEQGATQEIILKRLKKMKEIGYDKDQIEFAQKALEDPLDQLLLISIKKKIVSMLPKDAVQNDQN